MSGTPEPSGGDGGIDGGHRAGEGNGVAEGMEGASDGRQAAGSRGGERQEATDAERAQAEKLTREQLVDSYVHLQSEVRALRQQLEKKEEQRITVVKLLKRAKKRHDDEKGRQEQDAEPAPPPSARDRGLSLPLSALKGDHPDSPTASVKSIGGGSSILSFNQLTGMHRRVGSRRGPGSSLGLKELVDPDYRLSTVLEKLASDRVLSILESFVNSAEGESATPRGIKQFPSSFPILHSRMPNRMLPMGVDMLATGGQDSQAQRGLRRP